MPQLSDLSTRDQRTRLLGGWFIISLICLIPIVLHQSDDPSILGRYSSRYAVIVAAMLGFTLLTGLLYVLAAQNRLRLPALWLPQSRHAGWVIAGSGAALAVLAWVFLPVSSAGGGVVFRVYVVGLIIALMILLLYQTRTALQPAASFWLWLIPLAAVALGLLLNYAYIGTLPGSRFYEEPILADWSISIAEPNIPASRMFPARDPVSGNVYHTSASLYGLGLWSRAFGVDLIKGRILFRLLVYLALPFIYLAAERVYGRFAGISAVAIAVFIPVHHGYLYPTALVALTNAIGLYCFFSARDAQTSAGQRVRHLLAGFVTGLGMEGHPYAFAFVAGMGAVYGIEYLRQIRQTGRWLWQPFWLFVLGAAGAGLFFIAFRIAFSKGALTPANFVDALLRAYTHETNIGNTSDPTRRISKFISYFLGSYSAWFPLEFTLLVGGLAAAAWRGFRQQIIHDRRLLALALLSVGVLAALMTHNNPYYWIFFMPFVALLTGGLVVSVGGRAAGPNLVQVALIMTLISLLVSFTITAVPEQNADELIEMGYIIDELLPAEIQTVAGWQTYFYGLYPRVIPSTENFYMAPVSEWRGVEPPQAIIVTTGLDDSHPQLWDYIRDKE
ncbi:MAG TPA: hypothetical protein VKY59_01930, partial [Spirillospora sp.]|nr:hypothetical protein [Spirillospora sp.]